MTLVLNAGCVPMDVLMPHPAVAVWFPPLIFLQPIGLELTAPCTSVHARCLLYRPQE